MLGIVAVLFNPFMKFYLGKEMWKISDLVGGILFIVYFIKAMKK